MTQTSPALLRGRVLSEIKEVYPFYAQRQFVPVWSEKEKLTELAYELRFEIRQSRYDGLKPSDYHLPLIETFFEAIEKEEASGMAGSSTDLLELEILLSDAFFALAEDLDIGKVDPSRLKASWGIPRKSKSRAYEQLLEEAWRRKELRSSLEALYPKNPSYPKGKLLLRQLEDRSKSSPISWKPVKTDKSLHLGESSGFLPEIRQRLAFWGYASAASPKEGKVYDSLLLIQVMAFQKDRGISAEGVIGPSTISSLNESPEQLMDKIEVNLERMRWVPSEFFEKEAILVNIPSFQLVYHRGVDTLFTTKVIVGTVTHPTPIFTAPMSYLVLSPYWNIPPSIAKNETLPAIRKNSGYLQKNNMEVVTAGGQAVALSQVNWNAKPFPYLIRQKPGESNALGLVKFMFPNPFNVYLHDTPGKQLFDREQRTFSHGCIRMQHPQDLAELLLKSDQDWTSERLVKAMGAGKEEVVTLSRKIPVGIFYFTFWTEGAEKPRFFVDIYKRDAEVLALLRR
jgi:murein L,D-transpeptidase YcbB/YkuD